MQKFSAPKLTESVFPVIMLLSGIFFILLYVEYRASQDAETTHYIHITAESAVDVTENARANSVVEVDFSNDPRITKAQGYLDAKSYDKAEQIYFQILAEEPSAQIHNWLGTLYLKQEHYAQAIVSFSNALKLKPGYYRARYNRALALSAVDEPQKAINDYKSVISGFNNHAKSHLNLGLLYYQLKDYTKAINSFEKAADLSSGARKVKALYLLAKSHTKIMPAQKEAATENFNKVIRLQPNHIGARLGLVAIEFRDDEAGLKQRLERYDVMLALEPENLAIYKAMYETYRALGQEKKATAILEKALLHDPNNLNLQFDLVQSLKRAKQYSEAIGILQNILIVDPQNSKAYFLLGRLHYLKGDFDVALEAYEKAKQVRLKPSPELFNNIGLLYSKMGRYKDASKSYMDALSLRSVYPEVYYNLGLLALKQKNYDEAAHYFEVAIKQRPTYSQAYYNLGLVYTKLKDNDKAIIAYREALRLKPNDIRVQLNLGVRYAKVGELKRAQEIYESILKEDSSYFTAWLNLGLVYREQGAFDKAIEALEKAITLEPESKKAHRALAKSYSVKGDYKKATKILYALLAQDPADIKTRLAYARSYYRAKKRNTALREYKKVLKLDPNNRVALKMVEKIETRKRKRNAKK